MRFLRYCGTEQRKVDHVNQFEPISPLCFAMLKDFTLFREYLKSLINRFAVYIYITIIPKPVQ